MPKITQYAHFDNKKLFNHTDHVKLWNVLRKMEIPQTSLSPHAKPCRHGLDRTLQKQTSSRNKDVLFPYLFKLHDEYLFRELVWKKISMIFKTGGRRINNLHYSDADAVIAENAI